MNTGRTAQKKGETNVLRCGGVITHPRAVSWSLMIRRLKYSSGECKFHVDSVPLLLSAPSLSHLYSALPSLMPGYRDLIMELWIPDGDTEPFFFTSFMCLVYSLAWQLSEMSSLSTYFKYLEPPH